MRFNRTSLIEEKKNDALCINNNEIKHNIDLIQVPSQHIVHVYPIAIMEELKEKISQLTLEEVYELYRTGDKIGEGSFGEVRSNSRCPLLVFKLCKNFNRHYVERKIVPSATMKNAQDTFNLVYGEGMSRSFLLDNEQLQKYVDLQKRRDKQEILAFLVMIKIPGKEVFDLSEQDYVNWIDMNERWFELSPRSLYLQLYVYLQDKCIAMNDLHNSNVFFYWHKDKAVMHAIDLNNYFSLLEQYQSEMAAYHADIVDLVKCRIQLESILEVAGLQSFYFTFSVFRKILIYDDKNLLKRILKTRYYNIEHYISKCNSQSKKEKAYQLQDKFIDLILSFYQLVKNVYRQEAFRQLLSYYYENIYFFIKESSTLEKLEANATDMMMKMYPINSDNNALSYISDKKLTKSQFTKRKSIKRARFIDAFSAKSDGDRYTLSALDAIAKKIKSMLQLVLKK